MVLFAESLASPALKDIYTGIKKGDGEKTAVGGVKTLAGDAMLAVADGAKKAYNVTSAAGTRSNGRPTDRPRRTRAPRKGG